jgi:hypothetical protein
VNLRAGLTWAVLAAAAAASVWVFLAVDSHSHSVSDTLYGAVVPIGLIWLVAIGVVLVLRRTMARP